MPPIAPLPPPPAHVRPAPPSPAEWEDRLMEAYDWGRPLPVASRGVPAHRWLRAAATFRPQEALPEDPFPPGAARREAESLRALLRAPADQQASRLKALTLTQAGTAMGLWRWGQAQVRANRFPPETRRAWEDRLLAEGPGLTRGYALRHALCWALAEQDEARFAALKAQADPVADTLLGQIQRLFGLLGGPSPTLRLWRLPDRAYEDVPLERLGRRVWVCPAESGPLPEVPAGTAWIIPSAEGSLDDRSASLTPDLEAEAEPLAARLRTAGRTAWFAPSRAAFETLGLAWFPILLELDAQGRLATLRMGDAAPRNPRACFQSGVWPRKGRVQPRAQRRLRP